MRLHSILCIFVCQAPDSYLSSLLNLILQNAFCGIVLRVSKIILSVAMFMLLFGLADINY